MLIIHVIGYIHSGKSTFIRNYFGTDEKFDLTEYHIIKEALLKRNEFIPELAIEIILSLFGKHLINALKNNSLLVIESTGLNQNLNEILDLFNVLTILISTPTPIVKRRIEEKYSGSKIPTFVNKTNFALKRAFAKNSINYDIKYYNILDITIPEIALINFKEYKYNISNKKITNKWIYVIIILKAKFHHIFGRSGINKFNDLIKPIEQYIPKHKLILLYGNFYYK